MRWQKLYVLFLAIKKNCRKSRKTTSIDVVCLLVCPANRTQFQFITFLRGRTTSHLAMSFLIQLPISLSLAPQMLLEVPMLYTTCQWPSKDGSSVCFASYLLTLHESVSLCSSYSNWYLYESTLYGIPANACLCCRYVTGCLSDTMCLSFACN